MPGILFERRQDGTLIYPELDQLQFSGASDASHARSQLLRAVRMRANDSTARSIGHLRIPRRMVTNPQYQEALEEYVPSLVLSD